ncbi:MAG: hypothetical protein HYV92_15305 [Candidatus Rokubacteria bacterium]|nr:hypothetical protein [Candidatus Rokubacteria bacterium]MBI2555753.1 hypothetical protein [Candidatus Rokubacteria bacterium]
MRRLMALLLVAALLVGFAAPAAHAGGKTATNVALGLASFAVFNQLVGPLLHPRPAHATPVYVSQPVYVSPPPQQVIYTQPPQVVVVQPPPPPPAPTVVYYPHGRYELRANGIQYYWVWIPNPPPPPPAVPPPPAAPPS